MNRILAIIRKNLYSCLWQAMKLRFRLEVCGVIITTNTRR